MSKYDPLWENVGKRAGDSLTLSFYEVEQILGFPIDHSFLNFKAELKAYGWQAGKISLKGQTVSFTRCAAAMPDYLDDDIMRFFDGRNDSRELYEILASQLKNTVPEFTLKVQKTQISFYNNHLFAMVSLPRRKAERGIVVSFGLGYQLASPRVAVATEPYPNRWTLHVPVTEAEQLDGELLGWLREAYDFAAAK